MESFKIEVFRSVVVLFTEYHYSSFYICLWQKIKGKTNCSELVFENASLNQEQKAEILLVFLLWLEKRTLIFNFITSLE